jgi:hypothetical protein
LSQLIYHLFCSKPAVFKRPSSFLSFLRRFYLSSIILLTTTLQFVFQDHSHSLYPTLIKPFDQHAFRRRLRLCHSRRCCRGFASDRFKRKHDSCSRRDQQQRHVVSKQKSKWKLTRYQTDITQPLEIQNKIPNLATVEKRQLDQTTTTTKDNDVVTVSKSQGTTHDNIGYSWKPKTDDTNNILARRQLAKGTGTTTVNEGGYTITTSNTQGTTGDRKGYSWKPESGAILRRQVDGGVFRDGENDVTVSKSQGTTGDRTGFSWHRAGLL